MRKSYEGRKAEVIEATLRLAEVIGPDRVTTGAIAAEIGVTQPAIFRHFPTKAALWLAVARHVSDALATAWAEARASAGTPEGRIKALVATQFRQLRATPALPLLLFSRELNVENPELRAEFRHRLRSFHDLLEQEMAAGRAEGAFRGDLDPQDGAVLLTSLVQGLAIRWALGAREFQLEEEGRRLLAVQLALFKARHEERGG